MTVSATTRLSLAVEPPVARITLDNPPLNVIDIPMMEELSVALTEIDTRTDVSTIVFGAKGKAFSAGVDVAAHTPEKVNTMLEKFHGVIKALVATRKVTIAAVHGACLGGGAELAVVCDIVFTSRDASWGFPEIKLGCYPPVACTALAALIGQKKATELILTGRTISGDEAVAIGLANKSAIADEVPALVGETLEHLKCLSPVALSVTKKAIYAWDSMHFDKGLARAEKVYLEELMKTEDAVEGIRAFLEKRESRWRAR
ncbi:MAG TPA: enoyl-CoA hydratase/isomerase family protein [Terriglobales bacterium]|jgi:cyclohexa-1,5-dienecarbonyl-CoA hydratase|nr:enoyl-CoA hydratase/isomerase family protein [Terriglobales bacterium]